MKITDEDEDTNDNDNNDLNGMKQGGREGEAERMEFLVAQSTTLKTTASLHGIITRVSLRWDKLEK